MKQFKKIFAFAMALTLLLGALNPISVNAATVKLNKTSVTLKAGATCQLKLQNATKVTWSSSNKNVATVTARGLVTAVNKGTANIKAIDKKTKKSYTCKITCNTTVALNKTSLELYSGHDETLKLSNSTSTTWKTSDSKVAIVSESGVVTGVDKGTATITATNNKTKQKFTCKVTTNRHEIQIFENPHRQGNFNSMWNYTTYEGIQDYAQIKFGDPLDDNTGNNIELYSSDSSILRVDNQYHRGQIYGESKGNAVLTVISDGKTYKYDILVSNDIDDSIFDYEPAKAELAGYTYDSEKSYAVKTYANNILDFVWERNDVNLNRDIIRTWLKGSFPTLGLTPGVSTKEDVVRAMPVCPYHWYWGCNWYFPEDGGVYYVPYECLQPSRGVVRNILFIFNNNDILIGAIVN